MTSPSTAITLNIPYYDNKHIPTVLTIKLLKQRGIPIIKLSGHTSTSLQKTIKHLFEEFKIYQKTHNKNVYTKFYIHISNPLEYDVAYTTQLIGIMQRILYNSDTSITTDTSIQTTIQTIKYYFPLNRTLPTALPSETNEFKSYYIITNRYNLSAELQQNLLPLPRITYESTPPTQLQNILKHMLSTHLHIRYLGTIQNIPILQIHRLKPVYEELLKLKIKNLILQYRVIPEEVNLYTNLLSGLPSLITLIPPCKCGQYLLNSNCVCSKSQRRQYLYTVIAPILETKLAINSKSTIQLLKRRRNKPAIYYIPAKRLFGLYL